MSDLRESAFDVTNCEREPVHIPGAVQAGCTLLLFREDTGSLAAASDNLEHLFGEEARALIGCGPERFFGPEDAHVISSILGRQQGPVSRHFQLQDGSEQWVNLFRTEGLLGAEINALEDREEDPVRFSSGIADILAEVNAPADRAEALSGQDIMDFARRVTARFRAVSGYHRVMMYRFDTDWNGQIIAESHAPELTQSFLGLWFPSSDIPRQARALFLRNRVRPLVDLTRAPVPLLPDLNPLTGRPIDLSDCSIRAPSPIHVEYLTNMGVRATLTIALVVRGELWGLMTCHHYEAPFRLSPGRAGLCRMLCEAISATLSQIVQRAEADGMEAARQLIRRLRSDAMNAVEGVDFAAFISRHGAALTRLLGCDGSLFASGTVEVRFGARLPPEAERKLRDRAEKQVRLSGRDGWCTHFARGLWPDLRGEAAGGAAGVLALRPADGAFEFLAFRAARHTVTTWAGDPFKRVTAAEGVERLHPRRSFELWREETADRAEPWSREALAIARELANGLSEIDWVFEWRRTESKLAEARAETEHNALHDPLTDLPNRRYLNRMLERCVGIGAPEFRPLALLHIDLDRFKQINDTLGHAAGDHVLRHVANTLRSCMRREDFAARIGGDEFVIVSAGTPDREGLRALGERIVASLSRPIEFEGRECRFGASIGIAVQHDRLADVDVLLKRADLALYDSKRRGRGRISFFTSEMEERMEATRRLGEEVVSGLQHREFEAWFQPQFRAEDFSLAGAEALIRWNHPERGLLTPDSFLTMAEDMGVIAVLDSFMLERAVACLDDWFAKGLVLPKLSVNVSARRLRDPGLIASLHTIRGRDMRIAFELLETIYLDEIDDVMSWNIDGLREIGVELEVDDFGTGHTSIISLIRLRPNRLKIDRQIVEPVTRSAATRKLVASIVDIGNSLGIAVTAEGVETMEHAHVLRDLGCTILQGYAFARPMPEAAFRDFVTGHAARRA